MRRYAGSAAALVVLAVLGWRAARRWPPASVSGAEAQAKLHVLEDILRSRNDNDPRLDRDFNVLPEETKALVRKKYRELPPERRNELGTIVYLLGKNIRTVQDWEFLGQVAAEPPCLGLADCSRAANPPDNAVTLAYPALVAVKQAQRVLGETPDSPEALRVIAAAKGSKVLAVRRLAAMKSNEMY